MDGRSTLFDSKIRGICNLDANGDDSLNSLQIVSEVPCGDNRFTAIIDGMLKYTICFQRC